MKKIFATFFCLLLSSTMFSLPLGNPAEPTLYPLGIFTGRGDPCSFNWHLRAGYAGDFVFNRYLEVRRPPLPQGHAIRETRIRKHAGFLALNVYDMVDIFTTLGQTDIRINASEEVFGNDATFDGRLSTNTHFSWSVGSRATLLYWRCFSLGIEGEYFQTRPQLSKYFEANGGNTIYFSTGNHTSYKEWQIGAGVAYTIEQRCPSLGLTPYVGVKRAWVRFDTNNFTFTNSDGVLTIFDLKENKRWGYAVGATLHYCDCIGFTAEGRFGDEKALYINGQICF